MLILKSETKLINFSIRRVRTRKILYIIKHLLLGPFRKSVCQVNEPDRKFGYR